MSDNNFEYDYQIEYLESQMRGADFERYLTRLDEEISLGLFTPILLLRTADVGSYNLGVGHMQVYLWMLNAMNDDRAQYINKYILRKWTNYNFSPNAPSPKIKFRKMGNTDTDMIKQLLVALISGGKATVDLEELGQLAGLTLKQVRETLKEPEAAPQDTPDQEDDLPEARATIREIRNRVQAQVEKGFREHTFGPSMRLTMGYKRRFVKALESDGLQNPEALTEEFFWRMDNWISDVLPLGESEFSSPESFMALFGRVLDLELDRIKGQG